MTTRIARGKPLDIKPLALALLSAFGAVSLPAQAVVPDGFSGLGFLSPSASSNATGISADGSVVVGTANNASNINVRAFRWTGGGMTDLGVLPGGQYSYGNAVSGDGAFVVGESYGAGLHQAVRWSQSGSMLGLGALSAGLSSVASAVSADGSVVVGDSGTYSGTPGGYTVVTGTGNRTGSPTQAYRWTQTDSMVGLGYLGSGDSSRATGVSADGRVVVGASNSANHLANGTYDQAFLWTQSTNMVGLGTLGGGSPYSYAYGVSADGKVVVGTSSTVSSGLQAFRWTQAENMVALGSLGGTSYATAASADGSVIVGASKTAPTGLTQAFRWTQAGMVSVASWLSGAGVSLPTGWILLQATGVNGTGAVIVGNGFDTNGKDQAWLARVANTGTGGTGTGGTGSTGSTGNGFLPSIADFNNSVAETGSSAVQVGAGVPGLTLFGAHHRSILDNGLASASGSSCGWTTADYAHNDASHTRMGLVEVGACHDINTARIGVGIGQAWAKQDWSLGGRAKSSGQYLIFEAADAFANGIQPSLTAVYGHFNTTLDRNYQNGAAIDTSRGTPTATSTAIRLRVDWKNAAQLGSASLSPYAAYTRVRSNLDGYTETGGGFPVRFDSSSTVTKDFRVGVAGALALDGATDLHMGLEAVSRDDDNGSGISGQVLGLWSFSTPGTRINRTWARATADVDHRLSKTALITAGANAGSKGGDPSWGVTAGVRVSF